ncbi:TPA: hypothetical protein ACVU5E_004678 [Vibrio parahaemolyticus]
MIIKYLKLYDKPVCKAVVDTLVTVFFCALWPTLYVLSNTLKEYLGLPWQLSCFIEEACYWYEWLLNGLMWLLEAILTYGHFLVVILIGILFSYFYLKRKTTHTFIINYLFNKAVTPLFIVYYTATLVHWLLFLKPFERLEFLESNWEPVLSLSGLSFLALLIICWFFMRLAINLQAQILETDRQEKGERSVVDRIHDFRRVIIKEFES